MFEHTKLSQQKSRRAVSEEMIRAATKAEFLQHPSSMLLIVPPNDANRNTSYRKNTFLKALFALISKTIAEHVIAIGL